MLVAGSLLAASLCLATVSVTYGLWTARTAAPRNHFSTLRVRSPRLMSATLQAPATVALTWRPSPTAAITTITYQVLRSSSGPYVVVATGITGTSYIDTLPSMGTYSYRIEASASGFLAASNARSVTW